MKRVDIFGSTWFARERHVNIATIDTKGTRHWLIHRHNGNCVMIATVYTIELDRLLINLYTLILP